MAACMLLYDLIQVEKLQETLLKTEPNIHFEKRM